EGAIMRIARSGATVTAHADAGGTMATVLADEHTFNRALEGTGAAVAAINSPTQRVLSGRVEAVEEATERARELGARVFKLRVTGAYHTPYMIDAIRDFQAQVNSETLTTLRRRVISTVTGTTVEPDEDLGSLMTRQFCQTVRFVEAATEAARDSDLLIEVGPGKMLSGLAAEFIAGTPAIPIRAGAASAYGLLEVAGAAYAAGAPVQVGRLFGTASPAGQPG
ncbi:MAG: enediyne polyketide synthase, partial [Thermoleophilaceae bacterium]|nr:enediyne polyketide synthase [Thermoleophilaceae bacterium]